MPEERERERERRGRRTVERSPATGRHPVHTHRV